MPPSAKAPSTAVLSGAGREKASPVPGIDAIIGEFSVRVTEIMEAGHLYFDQHRLVDEHRPGLFFSVKGEALDLRGEVPTWRNIPMRRVEQDADDSE